MPVVDSMVRASVSVGRSLSPVGVEDFLEGIGLLVDPRKRYLIADVLRIGDHLVFIPPQEHRLDLVLRNQAGDDARLLVLEPRRKPAGRMRAKRPTQAP